MFVIWILSFCSLVLGESLEETNAKLRETNSALLNALKELSLETEVGNHLFDEAAVSTGADYAWAEDSAGDYCSSYSGGYSTKKAARQACIDRLAGGNTCLGVISWSCNGDWRVCYGGKTRGYAHYGVCGSFLEETNYAFGANVMGDYCYNYIGVGTRVKAEEKCKERLSLGEHCLGVISWSCSGYWRVCTSATKTRGFADYGVCGSWASEREEGPLPACWIRLPTGCEKGLGETNDPTKWFKDPHNGDTTSCSSTRLAAFENWCQKQDGENFWGTEEQLPGPRGSCDNFVCDSRFRVKTDTLCSDDQSSCDVGTCCETIPRAFCDNFQCHTYVVKTGIQCSGGESSCDFATCCEPSHYRAERGDCASNLNSGNVKIADEDLTTRHDRNCESHCEADAACYGFVLPNLQQDNWCKMYFIGELRGSTSSFQHSDTWQCFKKKEYINFEPTVEGDSRCQSYSSRTMINARDANIPHHSDAPTDLQRYRCARKCLGSTECVTFSIKHKRGDSGFSKCYINRQYYCANSRGPISWWSYAIKR